MTAVLEDTQEFVVNEWKTLNTVASPNKLPAGHSPNNQNVWMDEKPGSVITANGYSKLGEIPSNLPVTGLINFFRASTGESQLICTDGQNVYWTKDFVTFTSVASGLSAFFQLRGKVIRDKLWLTNGSDPVMTWDGTTLVQLDGTGGMPDVPKGKFIEYHDERVWLYGIDGELSSLRFTALTDTSGTEITPDDADAWPTDNEIQISEGDADIGTGIFLYRGYLYCSKQYSIWRIVGYDEYTYTRVKTRASTGTRFQESIRIKDNLVHFIGVDGLYVFDAEEAKRISDIVDPASSDTGVFAFRNLQQPLLNNQFWNVSDTADFAAGVAAPSNISTTGDELVLLPVDDTQADFALGIHSNTDHAISAGYVQLTYQSSGGSTTNAATGATPSLPGGVSGSIIGAASSINNLSESAVVGYRQIVNSAINIWQVVFTQSFHVGRVTIGKFYYERGDSPMVASAKLQYTTNGSTWADVPSGTVSLPASVFSSNSTLYSSPSFASGYYVTEQDISLSFPTITCTGIRLYVTVDKGAMIIRELYVYQAPYELTGTFRSKTLDYLSIPETFGFLTALVATNGETYQFFTESSADGSTWDAAVNVANGAPIGSTPRRYLRWGVTLISSTGDISPAVDKVYVGGTYLSAIHDTGGNIFQWAAFQAALNRAGQTVNFYFRAGATAGHVNAASWTAIVNGAIPSAVVTDDNIQIKIEMATENPAQAPSVQSFTVNWILDSGGGINTLQNVASIIILNRYWLSAATLGAAANDIVIVLGKLTAESPFHKKDWGFLSFCRFQDYYIAGSSTDGSLYRLEMGYSKDGASLDSYYETADFSKDGFQIKGRELHVTCDRSGPYTLSIGWSTDGGLTWTERAIDLTRVSGQSLSFTKKLNINFMADSVRFRARINEADQPFAVDELRLYYRLTPQRGTLAA